MQVVKDCMCQTFSVKGNIQIVASIYNLDLRNETENFVEMKGKYAMNIYKHIISFYQKKWIIMSIFQRSPVTYSIIESIRLF